MSLVSGSVPNLISGVSQQAPVLRLASQAEDSVNGFASVVTGLDKRPPTEHLAKLSGAIPATAFTHTIVRDEAERYVLAIHSDDLRVYDFEGAELTVAFPNGKGYLTGASFAAVTVADFTFVVNRDKVTALASETAPSRPPEALVAVRAGNYSTTYTVAVAVPGGAAVTATHTTPATGADAIKTETIATALRTQIAAAGFQVGQYGSTLHILAPVGSDPNIFTISTTDSMADQALTLIKGSVQSPALLPSKATDGFQVEIEGTAGNRFDNYWLQYAAQGSTGVWKEIPKPGRKIALDPATFPHVLVREEDGTFTFRQAEWAKCRSGDETVCPAPGLLGEKVADVFFYRNRLGLIGGEQVLISKRSLFFDFWRESAVTLLDTDPIDVAVSHVKVSKLLRAVPFNESLLLFSALTQFVIPAGAPLTPGEVDINQSTEFEAALGARPIGIGPYVYFGQQRGGYTAVREYFVDGDTRAPDANDTTAHCPNYLRGQIIDMAGSSSENVLAVLASGKRNSVWVYKFQYAEDEKVLAGWSRWDFAEGDMILSIEFIQSALFLLIRRADGLYLERMDLDPGRTIGDLPSVPKLDRMCSSDTFASVAVGETSTTVTLPFEDAGEFQAAVIEDDEATQTRAGRLLKVTRPAPNQVTYAGTVPASKVVIGRRYELRHTLSPLLVRTEAAGGGSIATLDGRLQLGKATLNYTESAYFRVEVTPYRRSTYTRVFTGRVVGSARWSLGSLALESGNMSFPIRSNNLNVRIDIVNDSPWPSRFLNMEWEGDFTPRSRRVD